MKKTIGVYADTYNGKVGQTLAYMQFFSQFGYVRMISTHENLDNIIKDIDVLVIPGGADVDPTLYGGLPGINDTRTNQHYEYLDKMLIPLFIQADKPIIGICRGMQRLNVYFGGTLNQHIIGHHQGDDRCKRLHNLQFPDNDSIYYVNSLHHQSVDKLGDNLEILAYTAIFDGCYSNHTNYQKWRRFDKNGKVESDEQLPVTVEVFRHTDLKVIGFQYHPEEFNCKVARMLIENLIEDE
jgi:putative glutamine amidotransferase